MKTVKLVIPIDFTPVTEHAITYAIELFEDHQKELVLLHILTNLKETKAEENLKQLQSKYSAPSLTVDYKIETGKIFDDIGRIAETIDADFIVMGTHETTRVNKLAAKRSRS